MPVRPCSDCGRPVARGSRCPQHAREANTAKHNPAYDRGAWRRLSRRIVAEHRRTVGPWCPGFEGEAHPSMDLTADHVVSLANGGALLDRSNVRVLCRSCNSRRGRA